MKIKLIRKQLIIEEMLSFLKTPGGAQAAIDYYERMRKYSCQCISISALAAVLLAGCADEPAQSSGPPVHKGESRAQVEARLGRPSEDRRNSAGQEVCTYSPGAAKMLVPIYGEFSGETEITVRYSHGVVVAWETQRIGL